MNLSMASPSKSWAAVVRCLFANFSLASLMSSGGSSARDTRKLVTPDIADATTILSPSVLAMIPATLLRASGEPTLVPPNFITVIIL